MGRRRRRKLGRRLELGAKISEANRKIKKSTLLHNEMYEMFSGLRVPTQFSMQFSTRFSHVNI